MVSILEEFTVHTLICPHCIDECIGIERQKEGRVQEYCRVSMQAAYPPRLCVQCQGPNCGRGDSGRWTSEARDTNYSSQQKCTSTNNFKK